MRGAPLLVAMVLLLVGCGSTEEPTKPFADRIGKLEAEVKAIREEMSGMRPAIERLVQVEGDIRQVVEDLKTLAEAPAPASAPSPAVAAAAQPPDTTPAPSPPLQKTAPEKTPPAAPERPSDPPSDKPISRDVPIAAAPPPSAPAPRMAGEAVPNAASMHAEPQKMGETKVMPAVVTATPQGGLAVHLASYGSRDTAARGWRTLQIKYPKLLGTLSAVIAPVETVRGATMLRLKAGPVPTDADVADLCKAIRQNGDFCMPETFDGTPLAGLRGAPGQPAGLQRAGSASQAQVAGR